MKILLMPGLTLPEISADDVARVRAAAGSDAEVIVTTPAEALKHAEQAEVILGPVPRQLLQAAPGCGGYKPPLRESIPTCTPSYATAT